MIIFTFGVNDKGSADIKSDDRGQPKIHVDGSCNAIGNIDLGSRKSISLLIYGGNSRQPTFDSPQRPALIFNQISNPDTHKVSLQRCKELCQSLDGVPVINHPDAVQDSSRDAVYRKLRHIEGLRIPKTVRCVPESPQHVFNLIESEGFEFPVIFRTAGEHNSMNMVLIKGSHDLEKLNAFAFDGSDHYLIEFIDCADERGIYTKYRIMMVDGKPYSRHVLFGTDWLVNSDSYEYMKANPEAGKPLAMLDNFDANVLPRAESVLTEVANRMKLDFFGIDCHIDDDGQLLIFEANANMFALTDSVPMLSPRAKIIQRQVREMIDRRSVSAPGEMFGFTRTVQN